MKIGIIDVDGHNFPNLALMRISAYHKQNGDHVEWWMGGFTHYDVVYMSKVFSFTPDINVPIDANIVIRGGSGYAISLVDGREVYDKSKDSDLPDDIEKCFPDYSIYPEYDFAVSMTSRGCPRGCPFCHVAAKEGRRSVKTADVSDFWNGQKTIQVLDPNILACSDKRDLMKQYRETGALIDYCQGLDIRLIDEDDIEDINHTRINEIHFAWDNPEQDLSDRFKFYADRTVKKPKGYYGMVYVLTNYNSTQEQDLYRIYKLRELGFNPYVMIYDKQHASREVKNLQRWCNNMWVFKSCPDYKDYSRREK